MNTEGGRRVYTLQERSSPLLRVFPSMMPYVKTCIDNLSIS